jgi:hypothetical protein
MPSVLISDDRADVESALASQPRFTDQQTKALYNWVLRLVTALFNYVSFFMGDNADRQISLQSRVTDLEEKFQELQSSSPVPATTSHTTPQQPPAPSSRSRCRRCSALGHDTKDCRTKDPVAVKKRVSNNQKARKSAATPTVIPPQHSPYHGPGNLFGDPMFPYSPPSTQAFSALAADAKELRRRKMQSTRDRRRRGATSTTT